MGDGTVTNVLGEQRQVVTTYENGAYDCPFCGYPTMGTCLNPACSAAQGASVEGAQRRRDEADARRREERQRERNVTAMQQAAEAARERQALEHAERLADARERGLCVRCAVAKTRREVRHRRPENCPLYERTFDDRG